MFNSFNINPLSPLFSTIVGLRNWCYDINAMKSYQLKIPVISVGNITMGGTGKTPFIQWLVSEISDLGYRPGVICKSYKASAKKPEWVNTDLGSFKMFGDEAVLLKLKNPSIPVLSGPNKWESALYMEQAANHSNVVILDDGFQHRKLKRNLDIVLLDVSVMEKDYQWPFKGRAREELKSLHRADVVVFTKWDQKNEETYEFLVKNISNNILRLFAYQEFEAIRKVAGRPMNSLAPISSLKGFGFCGLGNPSNFFSSLKSVGLNIVETYALNDHEEYSENLLKKIIEKAQNFDFAVTSEKDMVKLQAWPFNGPSLFVLPMKLKVSGNLEGFREILARNLWTNT